MRSAPTIRDGLRTLCEFAPLINPIGDFRFVLSAGGGALHYAVPGQRHTLSTQLNEYTLAVIVRQFGLMLDGRFPVLRAWFSHRQPSDAAAIAEHLGAEVTFGAPDCGFMVASATLERRPRTADASLFDFLLTMARAQLANIGTHDVVSQVIRVIEVRLAHGDVGAKAVAAAMATTVRSLQRGLAEAGTSFRDVLTHVRSRRRAELTRALLTEPEIASRLGFADARSMRRSLDSVARARLIAVSGPAALITHDLRPARRELR